MKKIFAPLTALLITASMLFLTGCDSLYIPEGTSTSSKATQNASGEYDPTSQGSTKYPAATVPTESTPQQSATQQSTQQTTKPPSAGTATGVITDEEMSKLITEKYLTVHPKSRPGYKLESLKNIVIHYVANPKTSALQNWKYFENKNYVSAHFIIDLDGSILQCMPLDEVAWAIGTTEGNYSTISIECCHPDSTGKFTDATYESLVKLVSWLCQKYNFTADQVKRHYDYPRTNSSGVVWHKSCPLYFVDHPEKWEEFKNALLIP